MTTDPDLLDVLPAVHPAPSSARDRRYGQALAGDAAVHAEIVENYARLVGNLINSLEDSGSACTVSRDTRLLVERVDPTVVAVVEPTIDAAPPSARGCSAPPGRRSTA